MPFKLKAIILLVTATILSLSYCRKNIDSSEGVKVEAPQLKVEPAPKVQETELSLPDPLAFEAKIHDAVARELVRIFEKGDYQRALDYARKHAYSPELAESSRQWIRRQIPSIMISLGWQKYQQTLYFDAIALFEEALQIRNEPLAIKGLAGSYFQLKYLWQAKHYSRLLLEQIPYEFDTSILLLETLESTQNLKAATELAHNLLQAPDLNREQRDFVDQKLKTLRARLQESQHQSTITSPHFALTYRADEHEGFVTWLLELMENTLDEFRIDWGFDEPKAPIEIILYPAERFSKLVHGPTWAQAIYDGRIRVPIGTREAPAMQHLERVVRHELVHALTAQQTGHRPLPPWFAEGLAQYLECQGGCRNPIQNFSSGHFLSQEVFQQSFLNLSKDQARRAYGQSLFLIQILVQIKGSQAITRTLEALGPSSLIDSNQILGPLDLSFLSLYTSAQGIWENGKF